MDFRDRGREKRETETLGISLAVRSEIGEPGGICTLNPPADNGLLFYSATEAEMVGSAGNAPVITSGFIRRHLIYSRAARSLPLVALRKQW